MYDFEEQRIQTVLDSYGLKLLLLQNDIEETTVVELLVRKGILDIDDYFYQDVPEEGTEDEY
jgi:hypothetical protein